MKYLFHLLQYYRNFKLRKPVARSGFTLIEMLIVITIVGIIAGLAVSSYGSIRKQAKLDIAVDSLMSAFKEQGAKAKSGQHNPVSPGSGGSSQENANLQFSCFGLYLQKTVPYVQYDTTPYISANAQNADFCDYSQHASLPYDFLEEVELQDISVNGAAVDKLIFFAKPPFGKTVVSTDENTFAPFSKITLTIGLKNSAEKRYLEVDGLTATAHRIQKTSS